MDIHALKQNLSSLASKILAGRDTLPEVLADIDAAPNKHVLHIIMAELEAEAGQLLSLIAGGLDRVGARKEAAEARADAVPQIPMGEWEQP